MQVYLTIDDSPSSYMIEKVNFLKEQQIPALFYARGEYIKSYSDHVVHAIKAGFLIGNHSYSHPYFSKISFEECCNEILVTEKLIESCYAHAQIKRPYKIIRLPFADRGAGCKAVKAQTQKQQIKVEKIQKFLKLQNFKKINFINDNEDFIDAFWDWDTQDYKKRNIENMELYLNSMQEFYNNYSQEIAVILLHDFDHNHHLFEQSIQFLIDNKVKFLNYQDNNNL